MITHLLRTHLCMEPVAVASYRQLPTIHPLWKLLAPHIRGIMAINTLGRDILISSGGIADQLLSIGGGGNFLRPSNSMAQSNNIGTSLLCCSPSLKQENSDVAYGKHQWLKKVRECREGGMGGLREQKPFRVTP